MYKSIVTKSMVVLNINCSLKVNCKISWTDIKITEAVATFGSYLVHCDLGRVDGDAGGKLFCQRHVQDSSTTPW